jgi:hypothetical protein
MPTLIAGGDSFTWGSELPDQHMDHLVNIPSNKTWSALLAQHLNHNYICLAKPGCGNNTITRRIISEIANHPNEEIYVAVMWTYTHRSEIKLRNISPFNSITNDPLQSARFDIDNFWINFNAWHGLSFEEKMEYFPKDIDIERYEFFKEQHNKMSELGITNASKYYYTPTGDNYFHQYNFLKEINLLQFYLQSKNIKYFFCLASDEILKPDPSLVKESGLWQTVNWNNWYKDAAFHKWSEFHPKCGSHPGTDAHLDWFHLILPKAKECFQK